MSTPFPQETLTKSTSSNIPTLPSNKPSYAEVLKSNPEKMSTSMNSKVNHVKYDTGLNQNSKSDIEWTNNLYIERNCISQHKRKVNKFLQEQKDDVVLLAETDLTIFFSKK